MRLLLAVFAVWLLFAVLGFLLHVLWIVALIIAVGWLLGLASRRGRKAQWYRL